MDWWIDILYSFYSGKGAVIWLQVWCSSIHLFTHYLYLLIHTEGCRVYPSKQWVEYRETPWTVWVLKRKKTSNCNLSHYTQLSLTSYEEYIFVSGESVSLPVWERRQKREIIMCLNNTSLVFSSIFLSSLLTDTLWRWRVHHQTGGQRRHLLHHQ